MLREPLWISFLKLLVHRLIRLEGKETGPLSDGPSNRWEVSFERDRIRKYVRLESAMYMMDGVHLKGMAQVQISRASTVTKAQYQLSLMQHCEQRRRDSGSRTHTSKTQNLNIASSGGSN